MRSLGNKLLLVYAVLAYTAVMTLDIIGVSEMTMLTMPTYLLLN